MHALTCDNAGCASFGGKLQFLSVSNFKNLSGLAWRLPFTFHDEERT
jgi:hypothetical protein